jgi:hypothetical protein
VAKRCPIGTFSLYKNATTLKDCLSCPSGKNEREEWRRKMAHKEMAMFETNCPSGKPIQGKLRNSAWIQARILNWISTLL